MSDLFSATGSFEAYYGIHFHNLDVHSYVILLAPFDVTKILKIIKQLMKLPSNTSC